MISNGKSDKGEKDESRNQQHKGSVRSNADGAKTCGGGLSARTRYAKKQRNSKQKAHERVKHC